LTNPEECEGAKALLEGGRAVRQGLEGSFWPSRSKNGEARYIPMTSTVRAFIGKRPRSLNASALVFPNGEGKRDLRWAEKGFPTALSASKIDDFRLHDLRHTFASRLAMAGVDLLTIKDLGGWKSLPMVQSYAHLSPSHRKEAIERLSSPTTTPVKRQAVKN
jgi:integrase